MDEGHRHNWRYVLKKISLAFLVFFVFAVGIPLLIGTVLGIDSSLVLAQVTSVFMLQAVAPSIGMAIGLSAPLILTFMACFALGITVALIMICEGLAASSRRITRWVEKMKTMTDKHPIMQKYGPIGCFFVVWTPGIGLWGTPVLAWALKWKRVPSIFFTVTGFVVAAVIFMVFASRINEVLLFIANVGVLIFIVTCMVATGLSLSIQGIRGVVHNFRPLFIFAIAANFILVPIAGYLIVLGFSLPADVATGILLITTASGSSFLPLVRQVGKGQLVTAGVLAAILSVLSVLYIPLVLPSLLPAGTHADPVIIVAILLLLLLLPLVMAIFIRSKREAQAIRYTPWLSKISYIAFAASFIAVLIVYYREMPEMVGTGGFFAAILLILVAFGIGMLLGGRDSKIRAVLGYGTAQRNYAIAAVIAALAFTDRTILIMVLLTALLGLLLLWIFGRISPADPA